jgi:cytosine permease
MSNQTASQLPDYLTSAKANPQSNRGPWFKNSAPTYADIVSQKTNQRKMPA